MTAAESGENGAAHCVIDLPSHVGTPATQRSRSLPSMTVCDRHADQYTAAYDDDTRITDWEPL